MLYCYTSISDIGFLPAIQLYTLKGKVTSSAARGVLWADGEDELPSLRCHGSCSRTLRHELSRGAGPLGCDRQPTHQVMYIQYLIDNRHDNVLKNVWYEYNVCQCVISPDLYSSTCPKDALFWLELQFLWNNLSKRTRIFDFRLGSRKTFRGGVVALEVGPEQRA